MSELVKMLSEGDHAVEVSLRPESTPAALRESIGKGYVHLKFTATRGGTDLYIPLAKDLIDLTHANFDAPSGSVKLIGNLTLDYVPVRCIASIDLQTMQGTGHLEPVASER